MYLKVAHNTVKTLPVSVIPSVRSSVHTHRAQGNSTLIPHSLFVCRQDNMQEYEDSKCHSTSKNNSVSIEISGAYESLCFITGIVLHDYNFQMLWTIAPVSATTMMQCRMSTVVIVIVMSIV